MDRDSEFRGNPKSGRIGAAVIWFATAAESLRETAAKANRTPEELQSSAKRSTTPPTAIDVLKGFVSKRLLPTFSEASSNGSRRLLSRFASTGHAGQEDGTQ
jgi:hypothetical protein